MHAGVQELLVTCLALSRSVLSVHVQWALTKLERSLKAGVLFHAVGYHTVILVNNSPMAPSNLLGEISDPSCLSLRQEDRKLEVRRSFSTLLKLANGIDTAQVNVELLKELLHCHVLVVLMRVVDGTDKPHSLRGLFSFRASHF